MTNTLARPTRRTLVRGAAWSVPVVSIAAAAPAFAASGTSSLTGGAAVKWGNGSTKHVSWDLTLTNGAVAIDSVSITFTYTPNGGGTFTSFTINGYAPTDNTWAFSTIPVGGASSVTATHLDNIAANSTTRIHTDFAGSDNSAGTVSATATITYVGSSTTVQIPLGTVTWGAGSEHVH